MFTRLRAAALALACLGTQHAQAAPPPAEVFFKDPDIGEAVLSPSGRRLAITSAKGTPRAALVVYDLAPGGRGLRAAQFPEADVVNVHWVNDERLVFGVTDFSAGSGRPAGAPGLFTVKTDGSPMRQLVRRQWKPAINDGRDDRMLDWNHRLVAVPPSRPGKVNEEVLLVEFSSGGNHVETPVWLNAVNNTTRSVDYKEPLHTVGWMADSLGEPRIAFTQHKDRRAAYWQPPGSRTWTQLYESDLLGLPYRIEAVDDTGALFVSRFEGAQRQRALARYDFASGAPEAKPLVAVPGFDFAGDLVTNETGRTVGVRVVADGETTIWFDAAMKAFQERTDSLFAGRINRIDCRRCGAPDMVALVRSYSDRDPGRLYLFQGKPPEGEKSWRLFRAVREDIKPDQMATMELQRIKARDGLDLPVWVTRHPDAKGPLPAVVLVHGGPWVRGSEWRWDAEAQFLASRGYVVIAPEFRGSAGYGSVHLEAGFRQWGQAMQDDVADALRWAQKEGIASDKACIAGASYGGYSTLMGLVRDPALYRCGVAWLAVTDLDLLVQGSWWVDDDLDNDYRKYQMPERVGDAVKDAAMLAANSPVRQAARIKAPVLLAFGEQDQRVPLAHGKRMREALRAAGNDPVWVTYSGEAHGFGVVKNQVDFAERMAAFLAKHLQP
ncbi:MULTISPECIES: prolyl oligopeptidase family serine peptidase [unclassified Roseateles]|uniref:S9 family peptidase n=1 Tax=unclassified Roseateles TaxID=2626991 RepID=UPI000A7B2CBA|nr:MULTISPECIES: prolyl oligopeptidase family serine peptidase [unclassified Roseateles]